MTQEELVARLQYDAETGIFCRKNHVKHGLNGKAAGTWHPRGYRVVNVMGRRYLAHRLAWFYVHGEWPEQVDHINGVRDDNRLTNLRPATQSQNNANSARRKDNSSGVKGVCYSAPMKKWQARIKPHGMKRVVLGYFDTLEDAANAYAKAASEHFGIYARAA